MKSLRSRVLPVAAWALSFLMVAGLGAGAVISKSDSERLQRKIVQINENGRARRPVSLRTPITEDELNSYLTYALAQELPVGVTDLHITIEGGGRLSGRAIVDLNRVGAERSSGRGLDPLAYLGGKAPVMATGALRTSAGTGRLELESATISGVPVPKFLLQALVSSYTRSAENPEGISLDGTFTLPAGIRQIEVGKGQAVVVQ
jgi:hypothetical protein